MQKKKSNRRGGKHHKQHKKEKACKETQQSNLESNLESNLKTNLTRCKIKEVCDGDQIEYNVTYRSAPVSFSPQPNSTKNAYALWTVSNGEVGEVKLTEVSLDCKFEDQSKEYKDDYLVVSIWWRFFQEENKSGCTKFRCNKPLFVLTVYESSLGTMEITEMFIMPSMQSMKEYIQSRFLEFIKNQCGLCQSDDVNKEDWLTEVLDSFIQTGKTHFGECSTDYDFHFYKID